MPNERADILGDDADLMLLEGRECLANRFCIVCGACVP